MLQLGASPPRIVGGGRRLVCSPKAVCVGDCTVFPSLYNFIIIIMSILLYVLWHRTGLTEL